MAHSTQAFRGGTATLNDRSLLALVALLRRLEEREPDARLSAIVAAWYRAAEVSGPGMIDLTLDTLLTDDAAADFLAERLRRVAQEAGDVVPGAELNGAALPTGIVFSDFPADALREGIDALLALIARDGR